MKTKRFLSLVLLSAVVVSCLGISTEAAEYQGEVITCAVDATGSFNMDVPANTTVKAKSSFPLEVGEVVTIKATYSPFSASVDFGLIAPDNLFYGLNTKSGSFDEAIEVTQRGNYVLAVRNMTHFKMRWKRLGLLLRWCHLGCQNGIPFCL